MGNKITIVGCGPGVADLITVKGRQTIEKAGVIAGSRRLIETFTGGSAARTIVIEKDYGKGLSGLMTAPEGTNIVLLVSGDPLLSSLGTLAIKKLGKERCEVIPGVSSFQQAFASLKEGWTDHNIISLHGKDSHNIKKIFSENPKFALLLDPDRNLKYIKEAVGEAAGSEYEYHVASNLSLRGEEVKELSFEELATHPEQSLSILIVKKKKTAGGGKEAE
ncbi:hypothetical protein MNBD_DELTA01-1153 [hydrothermal vent metagenome]|uniref:Tetrapyrrole methylase domain-containing protein n=1 Tax=hydrothermal vent metagenome TaxID=652676 RepID=A0A3B0QQD5_9ZZZZ